MILLALLGDRHCRWNLVYLDIICGELSAETIELLECMKSWFKLGIFTEQDLTAIIETEEGVAEALEV